MSSNSAIPADLEALRVPIGDLEHYPRNPRQGDVGAIAESLAVNGQYRPVVVNRRTMEVLAGNHTVRAARELGWDEVAATFVDVDEEAAARIALVDNRANDVAGYDERALADLLASLPSLEGTGFDGDALDDLLRVLDPAEPGRDTDPVGVPDEPRTKPGDLYVLGRHRLLCGDATMSSDVGRLMGGGVADAMWTDPPYGVNYVGKTAESLTIQNDAPAALGDLLRAAFASATTALKAGAAIYLAHPAGALSAVFIEQFLAAGWSLRQTLVWNKGTMVLGHADYHYSHEPILFGYTDGPGRRGRGGEGWYGDNSQVSVLDHPKPAASREHPTSKPVALVEQCLLNSTPVQGGVCDPFAGSGSTLIACENLNRRCYAMEIDPAYCDVIVDRWERHTGKEAEREDG